MKNHLFAALFLLFNSCKTQTKFDKQKWGEEEGLMTFPNRKYMIDDLVKNVQLKGRSYKQIIELLGPPPPWWKLDSSFKLSYNIDMDFAKDHTLNYTEVLNLQFNKDSIVQAFDVLEWKK